MSSKLFQRGRGFIISRTDAVDAAHERYGLFVLISNEVEGPFHGAEPLQNVGCCGKGFLECKRAAESAKNDDFIRKAPWKES